MKKMNECIECYSADNRATPILHKRECLEEHEQYVCSTCGRCICIQQDSKRKLRRIDFPFKSLEIAKLYLRVADYLQQKPCAIFEYENTNGRKSYKIFSTPESFNIYIEKNEDKVATQEHPVFSQNEYRVFENTKTKMLSVDEIEEYLGT